MDSWRRNQPPTTSHGGRKPNRNVGNEAFQSSRNCQPANVERVAGGLDAPIPTQPLTATRRGHDTPLTPTLRGHDTPLDDRSPLHSSCDSGENRGTPHQLSRQANLLSAVLLLIKDLDSTGLAVVAHEVRWLIDEHNDI